jgi:hypothetical protein
MVAETPREPAHAFVAIPFSKTFEPVYETIAATLREAGLKPVRADEIRRSDPFIENIYNAIEQAGIVIGVTAQGNPNVAYELGFARHLNKEAILLTDDPRSIPSDLRDLHHLVYSRRDLATLGEELSKWIADSRLLSKDPLKRAVLRRGDVFDTVVDGTFYLQRARPLPTKAEIRDYLTHGLPMPQRLLYLTEDGQDTYLRLCDDPQYLYYRETVQWIGDNAASLVDRMLAHCGSTEVDFISLGPGNGRKDAVILSELVHRAGPLKYTYYYPYDVSGGLLLDAMRNILARDLPLEKLRVKAIEADVQVLPEFKRVFDYRTEPNIYSLLGGLANITSEVDLLTLLRRLMNPEDCLLLEVRKKADPRIKGLGKTDLNRRWDLAALRYVGADVDPALVQYDDVPSTSTIPNTRTVAALVSSLELDQHTFNDVSLFTVHYYDRDALTKVLEDVGFEVLLTEEQPNSLFYLCTRSAPRT